MAVSWKRWKTPTEVEERTGISFDRTPQGIVKAPAGQLRVCAYHIDFDEKPVVYADVDTRAEADDICDRLSKLSGDWNVDYAVIYDERGKLLRGPPW